MNDGNKATGSGCFSFPISPFFCSFSITVHFTQVNTKAFYALLSERQRAVRDGEDHNLAMLVLVAQGRVRSECYFDMSAPIGALAECLWPRERQEVKTLR